MTVSTPFNAVSIRNILFLTVVIFGAETFAQNKIGIQADFNIEQKLISINQVIEYQNNTRDTLTEIYLNDWSNSYSTKNTPLATRFAEEFDTKFHFAKSDDRGFTNITSIKENGNELYHQYVEKHPDILKVILSDAVFPGESYKINLSYNVVMPNSTFTDYGIDKNQNIYLKYWYITPAVYDGRWEYYSNKNLEDLYVPVADISMSVTYPKNYLLVSELNLIDVKVNPQSQTTLLNGKNRINSTLVLRKSADFNFIQTENFTVLTDINEEDVEKHEKAIIVDRITNYISENIGKYPHEQMLITTTDYKKEPLYGLNQLPSFLRPFSDSFQYELKIAKTAISHYLESTLLTNPRSDNWLNNGLEIYFLMKYIDEFYPDKKLLGSLADVWGIRSFHAADLKFNERYPLFYMEMARGNNDQPISMAKDSLIKFNANIAGKFKAGVGLTYLGDFMESETLDSTIESFLRDNQLKKVSTKEFENQLKLRTDKNIDWFFKDYIGTRKKMDFKIKEVKTEADSLIVTIKNKRKNNMPVSLFRIKDDSIISKQWVEHIDGEKTITIAKNDADKLVLNYDHVIPEFNLRDNWKSVDGSFFNNKPIQFRLFKDFEDPNYNQVFLMPLVEFNNIYDGLTLGAKFYNKTVLRKGFNYRLSPQFATKSKSFTGGGSAYYTQNVENSNLYNWSLGFGGKYNAIAEDAFVTVLTPSASISFRNDQDFRSNKFQHLNLRYLSIKRSIGLQAQITITEPDYSVWNLRYVNSDRNLIDFSSWYSDVQFAKKFGKVSVNYEYRKLSETNRQFNFRFFAGAFLYNNTNVESDYFSFALDRPTDYLFDYNYLGRSESSGIFSQQIIIAEGGFKSQLPVEFANQWMTTMSSSYSIWKYIEAYGDIGLFKNQDFRADFVYDSGIRLNLVPDYFEVFFPVYSSLGWEITQPEYEQKIRFKITVDPQVLLGLFKRKWY
ncbi:hypothetical protein SAMN03097699_0376 [Flavobacteriaceae bacterium MAR_2010_188]|nr:hypothetical protein SAMN03097699_0376 [Flavobacteriaceae bacterium MAR_2010_188]